MENSSRCSGGIGVVMVPRVLFTRGDDGCCEAGVGQATALGERPWRGIPDAEQPRDQGGLFTRTHSFLKKYLY